ncbi:MAG TPA: HepT-like ribonuclease domain-containing protein [Longimicrobiaceae bacterium]|nr:HepT-like ribonuclease domain-containing protein [Longimicrobiaceae bacterium]
MRDAAREAIGFAAGRTRNDLDTDRQLLLSIVKDIEIVGEAASRVGAQLRSHHPELPWAAIVATRNRLIHAYFDIDRDIVWDTVTTDLPPLVAVIERILEDQAP